MPPRAGEFVEEKEESAVKSRTLLAFCLVLAGLTSAGCAYNDYDRDDRRRGRWDRDNDRWDHDHDRWDRDHDRWDRDHDRWDRDHDHWR